LPQPPYIPTQQSKLVTWAENFNSLITATPTAFGVLPADATTINSYVAAFTAAYALSNKGSPGTRTPSAITNTNNLQAAMLGIVRTYAQQIRNNQGVTSANKQALGLNVPSSSRTPAPVPSTSPILSVVGATPLTLTCTIRDPTAPASARKKAVGARAYVVFYILQPIANPPPAAPGNQVIALGTKTPFPISFPTGSSGMMAYLWAAWTGRVVGSPGGAGFGPVSPVVSHVIP
jgi:hypothetical protein